MTLAYVVKRDNIDIMNLIADLHLHSKYSRAVSQSMTLPVMAEYAIQKGLDILTTGDFTHPLWLKEIQGELEEEGEGIYKIKDQKLKIKNTNEKLKNDNDVRFILSTEISSIYKQGDRVRRIHNLVFMPDMEAVERFNGELRKRGCNLNADGRPIIGLTSKNLLELVMTVDERAFLIPCHVWTPHFGLYGSASGFDSIEDAFGELSKYVYGIETGLSSDPDMNWQISELKNRSILSFSDAHSPAKMGREATVFKIKDTDQNLKISYDDIRRAIMRDPGGRLEIGYTVEFYPEEGKYHFSGHRNCKFVAGPEESEKAGHICPVCRRRLTEGVLYRVQQLADKKLAGRAILKEFPISNKEQESREAGVKWYVDRLGIQPPYVKLVPLLEIAAEALSSTVASQKTKNLFAEMCKRLGNEMEVLLRTPIEEIEKVGGEGVAEGVMKVREGNIVIHPGYDGVYGVVKIWDVPVATNQKDHRSGASLRDGSGSISLRDVKKGQKKISKGQLGLDLE